VWRHLWITHAPSISDVPTATDVKFKSSASSSQFPACYRGFVSQYSSSLCGEKDLLDLTANCDANRRRLSPTAESLNYLRKQLLLRKESQNRQLAGRKSFTAGKTINEVIKLTDCTLCILGRVKAGLWYYGYCCQLLIVIIFNVPIYFTIYFKFIMITI